VEPGERRIGRRFHKRLERNDAGQQHLKAWTAHRFLVIGHDVHAVQKYRLDGVLPAPQRQWIVAQRTKIRVEYQGWPTVMRHMTVPADPPPPRPNRPIRNPHPTLPRTRGRVGWGSEPKHLPSTL